MKLSIFMLAICLVLSLVSAIGGGNKGDLNRPKIDIFGKRERRSAALKGGVRVHPIFNFPRTTTPSVRKGEYSCKNKICRLRAGDEPKGCKGVCQYPIRL